MKRYRVLYSSLIHSKDLGRFPERDLRKIKKAIERKLTTAPDLFGKPLRKTLRGYWSLRVGAYRIIYRIRESDVLVLVIEHRSVVYEMAERVFE